MATMNERLQTYTGDGLEVGTLTLAEARERFDFAEVEVSETGHRTITVGEPIEMECADLDGLQADLRRAGLSSDLSRDERAEFATAFAEAVKKGGVL